MKIQNVPGEPPMLEIHATHDQGGLRVTAYLGGQPVEMESFELEIAHVMRDETQPGDEWRKIKHGPRRLILTLKEKGHDAAAAQPNALPF